MGLDIGVLGEELQNSPPKHCAYRSDAQAGRRAGREKSANKHLPHWKEFTQAALSFLRESQSQLSTNDRFKCFAWGKKAMTAFDEARLTPIFAYHPCASVTGPGSFNDFWEQDYGKRLIVPKS